jgi:heme-degrading monooxygenase HmoA
MIVVLFRNKLREDADLQEYERLFLRMRELADRVEGFLGIEVLPAGEREYLALARFDRAAALEAWRSDPAHLRVQAIGRERFYEWYTIEVATVSRSHGFPSARSPITLTD